MTVEEETEALAVARAARETLQQTGPWLAEEELDQVGGMVFWSTGILLLGIGKTSPTSPVGLNFFQILRLICQIFRQILIFELEN